MYQQPLTLPLALPYPLLQPGVGSFVVTTSVERPRPCFELRDCDNDAATVSVSEAVGLGPADRGHKNRSLGFGHQHGPYIRVSK